ncbi:hypothetical protein [Vibrio phage S4-7]|nr:hypothetical protein [Vibrio phage S4-7]
MKGFLLSVLRYTSCFTVLTILASFLGLLITLDINYLWVGLWDIEVRGIVFILITLLSFINTFRDDGRIL